jgi:predicted RNase H-like HicB family nuclease
VEQQQLHVDVEREAGVYWAQVSEWPGCFATGGTLKELMEALEEAIGLFVTPDDEELPSLRLSVRGLDLVVESRQALRPARQELAGFDESPLVRSRDPHRGGPSLGWPRR